MLPRIRPVEPARRSKSPGRLTPGAWDIKLSGLLANTSNGMAPRAAASVAVRRAWEGDGFIVVSSALL